ncbi:NAD-glutamate dehydrogenase domain-containing protein [Caulobacter segnis]
MRINGSDLLGQGRGRGRESRVSARRGRIEFAQAGGRLNTDAIDNSAGVSTAPTTRSISRS